MLLFASKIISHRMNFSGFFFCLAGGLLAISAQTAWGDEESLKIKDGASATGSNHTSEISGRSQIEPASSDSSDIGPGTYHIPPTANMRYELQEKLINAVPGDVIQLEEGVYELTGQLDIACSHLTIRGRGPEKTILSFKGQTVGGEGIVATGDAFVIEDLAIEDTAGNAIKNLGANGVTYRRVRVEWTGGPSSENGAYGLYPVQCRNVLIEECVAIAASDAGIYVGQSQNVVVRRCRAEKNVAGIEIENTINADVYDNVAENNTGGLLVFDLPGLQQKNGGNVRLFRNKVINNNTENFAPKGAMVAEVPSGTGIMIMATDRVEVFENDIINNDSTNLLIISFLFTQRPVNDPDYDPYPEGIHIHHNKVGEGGRSPDQRLKQLTAVIGSTFPDMIYDGLINPSRLVDGELPAEFSIRIHDNLPGMTIANINIADMTPQKILSGEYLVDRSFNSFQGKLPPLTAAVLGKHPELSHELKPAVAAYRGMPQKLSDWELFVGDGRSQHPADGVIPYQMNTQLFSDYATKYRFIKLPVGKTITYHDEEVFDFPVGTAIAKTFSYPADMRNPGSDERLLETRVEFLNEAGWYGASYVWNDEQDEAYLALGGAGLRATWIHRDGDRRDIHYEVPNANQCISCHSNNEKYRPIGPTARSLNRDFPESASYHGNQLKQLAEMGLLTGVPRSEAIPALARFDDPTTGTVEARARAWLDVNCAHCHSPEGSARTSGLDLRISQSNPAKFGVWKSPVAAGKGTGGRSYDVVPGKPDSSIMLYRLESDEAGVRMPNLARSLVQDESVALIREWISQMPESHRQHLDQ
ncbi:parallel beta-helix domain-containing protein [Calycomorphotria hydatis]|uniref:Planctomycete cytochrome C n=1 Tax=Calycomorphotria hydatis TaxID=2528027 RepID=A0A517T944_9PLAN|nr:parallel beta-helix domain-containing protein [Calycomorphotria hydatis]QDT64901.1 Planctomycete cytochrome C [Calycomorphotria hydatis]